MRSPYRSPYRRRSPYRSPFRGGLHRYALGRYRTDYTEDSRGRRYGSLRQESVANGFVISRSVVRVHSPAPTKTGILIPFSFLPGPSPGANSWRSAGRARRTRLWGASRNFCSPSTRRRLPASSGRSSLAQVGSLLVPGSACGCRSSRRGKFGASGRSTTRSGMNPRRRTSWCSGSFTRARIAARG